MAQDVEHLTVGRPDEEPPNSPWLGREGVNDLITATSSLIVGLVHIIYRDRDHWVGPCRGVPGQQLQASTRRREITGHPFQTQVLTLETQVITVELVGSGDVRDDHVGDDAHNPHVISLTGG